MGAREREEAMREHGIYECPDWCVQPDDEEQYEQHFSNWAEYDINGSTKLQIRIRATWWSDYENNLVEVNLYDTDGDQGAFLERPDWGKVQDYVEAGWTATEDWDTQWAFDGARQLAIARGDYNDEDDEEETDWTQLKTDVSLDLIEASGAYGNLWLDDGHGGD
jgi:hypothetical protein